MSQELLRASLRLVDSTRLLDHNYGIPPASTVLAGELTELHTKYVFLYNALLDKLNTLLYLNKLKDLSVESLESINSLFSAVAQAFPLFDSADLPSFLSSQNRVKTQHLLANYLQVILPIIRSIHSQDGSAVQSTILDGLKRNFSLDSGSTFEVMKKYALQTKQEKQYQEQLTELKHLLIQLEPKMTQFAQLNQKLTEANTRYILAKSSKLENEQVDDTIRDKYRKLVDQWRYLSKICEFLPVLVCNLSVNWYTETALFSIVNQCQTYASKLAKYQLIINADTINEFSVSELLLLDFEEIDLDIE